MRTRTFPLLLAALAGLAVAGCIELETVTTTDYGPPKPAKPSDPLADDRLDDRPAPPFDPDRVDRRPLGEWRLNASAAVVRLDVPAVKPDVEADLLTLHPSYAAAVAAARRASPDAEILPSVNLVDGKAKQVDDGLYAALDRAYYRGLSDHLHSHVDLIRRLYKSVGKDGPAAPYLAAGLELAGVKVETADPGRKDAYLRDFDADEVASKPIGFYTWDKELAACFRFLRFFQHADAAVAADLARALDHDAALRADYRKAVAFYAKLTNPLICKSLLDLCKDPGNKPPSRVSHDGVSVFPPSSCRETVLFEKLFPKGLPENADLMHELIRAVRSGKVDLTPTADSGWYEYQAHALETLLLPEKGEEHGKLLLTKAYKERMLEAFKALITKRRETHVRQMGMAYCGATAHAPPPAPVLVKPRLRVEPCPTYFLRTARAYAFLANFLEVSVGEEGLRSLHGLRQGGERTPDLYAELHDMRDLFYGLYLVSAEDVGMKPAFAPDEAVDADRCYRLASDWLPKAFDDPDIAVDTRVVVPVAVDPVRKATRVWATLGVRLAKLDADYARPPHLKPADGGEWKPVEAGRLGTSHYLIAVDEFAEVELPGLRTLTREEFRAVCDREKTKEAIVAALRKK
jgi:hypothetical protein